MKFLKMFFAGLLAFVVGSAVMLFLSVMILFGIVGSMTSSEAVTVGEHAILKLDFSEDLIDSPSSDPFAGIDFATMTAKRQVTLYNALRAIETAKIDPRIQGIYLRPNGGGMATYAILEELREALQDFRQGGKFIIAYNETYGQGGYYLASAADKIYLEPHGGMQWTGVSSTLMFYKGLFDKLDIQAEIFRPTACRYKSAVEPYFLSKMSNANREQMQLLVDSYWNVMAEAVAESRGIELSLSTKNIRTFDLEPIGRRARSVAGTGGARSWDGGRIAVRGSDGRCVPRARRRGQERRTVRVRDIGTIRVAVECGS